MFGIESSEVIVDFANFEPSQLLDALTYGGAMLLIGMFTVFAVLCLLWLFLSLFKVFFHDLPAKRDEKAAIAVPVTPVQEVTAPASASDSEIVAVIAAAIAMAESESNGTKFRVVSFKRK